MAKLTEFVKEAIRRMLFIPCVLGLSNGEFVCETGTLKHRFYEWLYGNGEPMFDTQWPE